MKVVFIAGPFRGCNHWEIECNIREAERIALQIWRAGYAVICPHTNTRFFDGALPDEVWLEGDKELLRRCDAVYCAAPINPKYQSEGVKAELMLARELGIPIAYSIENLPL